MKKSLTGVCATALAAAGFFLLPAVNAQQQSPSASPPTKGVPSTPTNIPDNKLDAAAAAVKNVSAVKDSYKQKIAQAPAADRERIFEKYYRSDDTSETAGLGLGLYIVRQIIQRHQGSVRAVVGEPGNGGCFECWLPLAQCPEGGQA